MFMVYVVFVLYSDCGQGHEFSIIVRTSVLIYIEALCSFVPNHYSDMQACMSLSQQLLSYVNTVI